MATLGISKDDRSLIVAHAQDEGHIFPQLHCTIEFQDVDDQFVPVLTFCPVIDEEKDEESQRRIADKLKTLVIDSIKFNIRIKWDPDGELHALVIKDGKRYILPLPKKVVLPADDKVEPNKFVV